MNYIISLLYSDFYFFSNDKTRDLLINFINVIFVTIYFGQLLACANHIGAVHEILPNWRSPMRQDNSVFYSHQLCSSWYFNSTWTLTLFLGNNASIEPGNTQVASQSFNFKHIGNDKFIQFTNEEVLEYKIELIIMI